MAFIKATAEVLGHFLYGSKAYPIRVRVRVRVGVWVSVRVGVMVR